jgi:hypothetical protein
MEDSKKAYLDPRQDRASIECGSHQPPGIWRTKVKIIIPSIAIDHAAIMVIHKSLALSKHFHTISAIKAGYFHNAFGKAIQSDAVEITILGPVDEEWVESLVKTASEDLRDSECDMVAIYDPKMDEIKTLDLKVYGVVTEQAK